MDTKKQEKQDKLNRIAGRCKVCGSHLQYIYGTNVVLCNNSKCLGYANKKYNKGERRQVSRLLTNNQAALAMLLCDEGDLRY